MPPPSLTSKKKSQDSLLLSTFEQMLYKASDRRIEAIFDRNKPRILRMMLMNLFESDVRSIRHGHQSNLDRLDGNARFLAKGYRQREIHYSHQYNDLLTQWEGSLGVCVRGDLFNLPDSIICEILSFQTPWDVCSHIRLTSKGLHTLTHTNGAWTNFQLTSHSLPMTSALQSSCFFSIRHLEIDIGLIRKSPDYNFIMSHIYSSGRTHNKVEQFRSSIESLLSSCHSLSRLTLHNSNVSDGLQQGYVSTWQNIITLGPSLPIHDLTIQFNDQYRRSDEIVLLNIGANVFTLFQFGIPWNNIQILDIMSMEIEFPEEYVQCLPIVFPNVKRLRIGRLSNVNAVLCLGLLDHLTHCMIGFHFQFDREYKKRVHESVKDIVRNRKNQFVVIDYTTDLWQEDERDPWAVSVIYPVHLFDEELHPEVKDRPVWEPMYENCLGTVDVELSDLFLEQFLRGKRNWKFQGRVWEENGESDVLNYGKLFFPVDRF